MPSSYTSSLRLTLPATGELTGTWGTTVNDGITTLLDNAVAGAATITMTAADYTLTTSNGATDEARAKILILTGTPGAARNVICPAVSKTYIVYNNTTGGFAQTIKTSAGTGISVPNGKTKIVRCDGTNVVEGFDAAGSVDLTGNLSYTGTLTGGTGIVNLGSGQFYKDVSGNVGIGTSSPGAKLEVYQAANNVVRVGAGSTSTAGINFNSNGGTYNTTSFLIQQSSTQVAQLLNFAAQPMTFGNSGAEQMRLDATGNLGIGGTPNFKLDVLDASAATVRARTTSSGNAALIASTAAGGAGYLQLTNAAGDHYIYGGIGGTQNIAFTLGVTEGMRLNSTGLGIGTSSPGAKLDVQGSSIRLLSGVATSFSFLDIGTNAGKVRLGAAGAANDFLTGSVQGDGALYTVDSKSLLFGTAQIERMRLDSSGNLGIGTSSPVSKLQINNGASTAVALSFGPVAAAGDYSQIIWTPTSGSQNLDFSIDGGFFKWSRQGSEFMRLDASGNLGIGTSSPGARLDVQAPEGRVILTSTTGTNASYYTAVNTGGSFFIGRDNSSGGLSGTAYAAALISTGAYPMVFGTNSAEKMRLDSSGNLGLGVTPSAWSARALQIGGRASVYTFGNDTHLGYNTYYDTQYKYIDGDGASHYQQSGGNHLWLTAPSGTAGNVISFTQAMTLTTDTKLLVGTAAPVFPSATRANVEVNGASQALFGLSVAGTAGGYLLHDGTDMILYQTRAGAMVFGTNNTERARIDALGRFGIGRVPGGTVLLDVQSDAEGIIRVRGGTGSGQGSAFYGTSGSDTTRYAFGQVSRVLGGTPGDDAVVYSVGYLAFAPGTVERARITSGGEFFVGTVSAVGSATDRLQVDAPSSARAGVFRNPTTGVDTIAAWNSDTSGDNKFVQFYTEGSATIRGLIDYNRAGGLTRYNTTSDYRAKDIIGPVQNPGATIDALKVYEGVMKGATQSRPMLIAHEAQAHAPYAVSGVKDEVNEDGTPKYQQMDVSSLVPLLLAEIQSLRDRVAQLEAKV